MLVPGQLRSTGRRVVLVDPANTLPCCFCRAWRRGVDLGACSPVPVPLLPGLLDAVLGKEEEDGLCCLSGG